jgi:hypothetical protein
MMAGNGLFPMKNGLFQPREKRTAAIILNGGNRDGWEKCRGINAD